MSETKHTKHNPLVDYFETSVQEIRKVTWPTRQQAVRMTVLVISFCLVAAVILGTVDFVFNFGYRKLVEISPAGSQPSILDQIPEGSTTPTTTTSPEVKVNNVTGTDVNGQPITVAPADNGNTGSELTPRTIQPAATPTTGGTQQ